MQGLHWWDFSRWNGRINGAAIKARGVDGIMSRSTIGTSGVRDIQYENNSRQADENGLLFGAYGVNWPINRNPELEAEVFVEQAYDPRLPKLPDVLAGDFELGARTHKAGHHKISGEELVEQAVRYMRKLRELLPEILLILYTGHWFWNDEKLLPHVGKGEDEFPGWFASYPIDPKQIKYLPPRYSADVLDPREVNPDLEVKIPIPWTKANTMAWQWSSKGRGKVDGYQESTFIDRNVLFAPIGPPPPNGGPTPSERIREAGAIIDEQTAELDRIANELER
jgi:hypothetical protein